MRKTVLYIAASLDGKIARPNGDVDWLDQVPNPDQSDYGYTKFYTSIDSVVMGRKTFEKMLTLTDKDPYQDKACYILTSLNLSPWNSYHIIQEEATSFIKKMKGSPGKDIWLVGGGELNTSLHNAGLIDEMMLFIMPVILGEGIPLFANFPKESPMTLLQSMVYKGGVTMLHYAFN